MTPSGTENSRGGSNRVTSPTRRENAARHPASLQSRIRNPLRFDKLGNRRPPFPALVAIYAVKLHDKNGALPRQRHDTCIHYIYSSPFHSLIPKNASAVPFPLGLRFRNAVRADRRSTAWPSAMQRLQPVDRSVLRMTSIKNRSQVRAENHPRSCPFLGYKRPSN